MQLMLPCKTATTLVTADYLDDPFFTLCSELPRHQLLLVWQHTCPCSHLQSSTP